MFKDIMHEIFHAFKDTSIIFLIVLLIYVIISFIEGKLANNLSKNNKYNPLIGAAIGLIPQCGFSVIGADLYRKRYITIGTLFAIFISTSDEALPIILSSSDKFLTVIPLLIIKFFIAILFGYLIDYIVKEKTIKNEEVTISTHKGCCHHEIEQHNESKLQKHFIHPFIHSLKICLYVLVINIAFNLILYFIGENAIKSFLNSNVFLTPLLSSLVGLIPNCASSVVISELYIESALSFSATLSGLICNSGLGIVYLFKDKSKIKNTLFILLTLFLISIFIGYISLLIELAII